MEKLQKPGQQVKFLSNPDISIKAQDQEDITNYINIRKRKNPDQEIFTNLKEDLMQSFQQMMYSEISQIKEQNSMILESNAKIIELLKANEAKFKEINDKVQLLETRYNAEQVRIGELEMQLNELQKQSIKNTIEIRNIPYKTQENVHEIVNNIHNTLKILPSATAIKIYRRGKHNGPIIVECHDTEEKEMILKAAKKYNFENKDTPLNTTILGINEESTRVYISEALTPMAKKILAGAREFVKNGSYKYCWVSRGNILMRKEEGQSAIVIKTLSQINDMNNK